VATNLFHWLSAAPNVPAEGPETPNCKLRIIVAKQLSEESKTAVDVMIRGWSRNRAAWLGRSLAIVSKPTADPIPV